MATGVPLTNSMVTVLVYWYQWCSQQLEWVVRQTSSKNESSANACCIGHVVYRRKRRKAAARLCACFNSFWGLWEENLFRRWGQTVPVGFHW